MCCSDTYLAMARGGLYVKHFRVLPIEGGIVAKTRRGFAVMEPSRQREIASKGGKAAHEKGTAHTWSEQEAKEAGRKGGAASHRNGHRTAFRGQAPAGEPAAEESAHHENAGDDHGAEDLTTKEPEPNGVPS
jgi:general stress protein YciG